KFQRGFEVELPLAGEEVGNTVLAQSGEVRVGDVLGEYDDDRVAADIGPAPGDLPARIQHDPICLGIASGKPRLSRVAPIGAGIIGARLRELLPGHAADEPRVTADLAVQALEEIAPVASRWPPSAVQDASVNARHHVANDVWFHSRRHLSSPRSSHENPLFETRLH